MYKFLKWNILDFRKDSGKEKIRCPSCNDIRTDKKDKSLTINHDEGFGKCQYCEILTFKNNNSVSYKTYKLPPQEWRNYTKLSDGMVKWFKSRKIDQQTLIELGVTEECYYQPAISKEVNNMVFNYFEGESLVNKKYRDSNKNFTQSSGAKSIFYNINSIVGDSECYIVEGEMDVLSISSL